MRKYIHELPDWPTFRWNASVVDPILDVVRFRQGQLVGQMETLVLPLRERASLAVLTQDILKTSEIEGEHLDPDQVRSSLARRLGIEIIGAKPTDRQVDGIVAMMLDATVNFDQPLTSERLFQWHTGLFPLLRSGQAPIRTGAWRVGEMQVVSGFMGREYVHFQPPPAVQIDEEMTRFLVWFNDEAQTSLIVKAAIAHLWFVTIHPFDDGNGRIARAISDLLLARSEQSIARFYSMSTQIQKERTAYYDILEETETGSLDITAWLTWFLECLGRSIESAQVGMKEVISTAQFWRTLQELPLNGRQKLILDKMLRGFEGKLTSAKWAKIAKTSHDTALRDINDLVERGILVKDASGGRSTSYILAHSLTLPDWPEHR